MQSAAERKASLRAEVWRRRRALPVAARDEAGTRIATHGLEWAARVVPDHGTLTAYLGVGSEPPTLPLLGQLFERGYHVLLPVCEPERRLSWVEWRPDIAYARSRYAPIQEPVGPRLGTAAVRTGDDGRPAAAAILLPATALDLDGRRLGQGGGYYDRFLAALDDGGSPLATAAVVYDDEVLASGAVPDEPLDRRVGAAVTPHGLHHFPESAE